MDSRKMYDQLYKQFLKEDSLSELGEELLSAGKIKVRVSDRFDPFLIFFIWSSLNTTTPITPLVIFTASTEAADDLAAALSSLLPRTMVDIFLPWDTFFYEAYSPSAEIAGNRCRILHDLRENKTEILIIPSRSVIQKVPTAAELDIAGYLEIQRDEETRPDGVAEKLVRMGYGRVPLVEQRGQFSIRGFIVDIFPSTSDKPVRLEFFGDEIDRMAFFDIAGQRSAENISAIRIYPCAEYVFDARRREVVREHLRSSDTLVEAEAEDFLAELESSDQVNGIERFAPTAGIGQCPLLDHVPKNACFIVTEADLFQIVLDKTYAGMLEGAGEAAELKLAPPECKEYLHEPSDVFQRIQDMRTVVSSFNLAGEDAPLVIGIDTEMIAVDTALPPVFNNNFTELAEYLKAKKKKYKIYLQTHDDGQKRRLQVILSREDIHLETIDHIKGNPFAFNGRIAMGFVLDAAGIIFLGLREIYGRFADQKTTKQRSSGRSLVLNDLEHGDLVVHANYGLARFEGLNYIEVGEATWECLDLRFKDGNLKVRTDAIGEITKYIGADETEPALSTMSSNVWAKTKTRARTSVKKLAIDLVKLYAERVSQKGNAFTPDNLWQKEMEDAFPFEETDDQLVVAGDIKKDMESEKPMDRLLCGDVGFGKTEIAVRSAFKAVMDGFQVMIFVPTTILAKQHFETFSQRYISFPVNVEMLSRFKTKKEQAKIISDFSAGKIDVLIGTHRLLSKDVAPHHLGLVIIDEEQRFGVEAKEKLKLIKKGVDVLMMSATPIPRTLQMSLGGIRDLSQINTAPEDRRPVQTFVSEYNEEVAINAIKRELRRDGQVFYVHNNVERIAKVAAGISARLPEARVAVAHGKMDSRSLEDIIMRFSNKEIDVLVATTIIESGIDIPNANTLIVSDSERLGLAQAYQLRGRVGRSSERAFAYFFYTKDKLMQGKAYHRLKTLKEHSGLNSGLKIALKDLEIRGAGNLLGGEQHGKIAEVGFELYSQMLTQEINVLKNEPEAPSLEVSVTIPVDAVIPEKYVNEPSVRIELYRRMNAIKNEDELGDLLSELSDRFGKIPSEVQSLLEVVSIKLVAAALGIKTIIWQNQELSFMPIDIERDEVKGLIKEALPGVSAAAHYNKALRTLKISKVPKEYCANYCLAVAKELLRNVEN